MIKSFRKDQIEDALKLAQISRRFPFLERGDAPYIRVVYEDSTISRAFIAKRMIEFENSPRALVIASEFGIWPSSEDANLSEALFRQLGCGGNVHIFPCHLFPSDEMANLISFLHISLLFGWGCELYLLGERAVFYGLDHDGFIDICVNNKEVFGAYLERWEGLDLKVRVHN